MTEPTTRDESPDDPHTYINRIDRTIVALLTERRRLRAAGGALSPASTARIFDVIEAETKAGRS